MSEQFSVQEDFDTVWARVKAHNKIVHEKNEELLQKAIANAPEGKEPFDIEEFAKVYPLTDVYGDSQITPSIAENYKRMYYLDYPQAKSMRELADLKYESDEHSGT